MNKPKILVTAAAGKTGLATAHQLLRAGFPVRAMVHRIDHRSDMLRRAGAEVVAGSLEDIADLRVALTGVSRAYYCPPLTPGALRRATLFAVVAQEAKLEVIVALSQWLSDPLHPAIHAREKWLSGKVFEWVPGVDTITINPGFFADNYLMALEPIAHFGLMAMPLGAGLNAPPSNEDIARVIVGAISNPAGRIGKSYRPTGPRLMPPEEIASIIGIALGRRVKYQNAPLKLFLKAAKSLGVADYVMEELSWFLQDYQRGSFAIGAPTDAVREVGEAEPESFETIVRRYVEKSPFSKRTMGSRALALRNILKALMTPVPSMQSVGKRLELPPVAHAVLAADSPEWTRSHHLDDSVSGKNPDCGS